VVVRGRGGRDTYCLERSACGNEYRVAGCVEVKQSADKPPNRRYRRNRVISGWATIRSEPLMRSMRMPIHMTPVTGEDYAESAEQLVQRK
jgi:hypothetical protein